MRSPVRKIATAFLAAVSLTGSLLFISGPASATTATDTATAAQSATQAPEGHWVAKNPRTGSGATVTPLTQTSCPAGTTAYTGTDAPYSCLTVFLDGGNHQVGLRQERTGSETAGFGYLHALNDHNVEEQTIEHAVQINAAGVLQPNNRRLYGAEFVSSDGKTVEEFEAYEDQNPSSAAPDNYALGIVTAYCTSGIGGPVSSCPQWVNDTL